MLLRRQANDVRAASYDLGGVLDPLLVPLDRIRTSGGDTRLHPDPLSLLNGYGCRPFPRPEAFTFSTSVMYSATCVQVTTSTLASGSSIPVASPTRYESHLRWLRRSER